MLGCVLSYEPPWTVCDGEIDENGWGAARRGGEGREMVMALNVPV